MPGFVPDASVTLAWCFEDEATAGTDALLKSLKGDAQENRCCQSELEGRCYA
jgi:hypothetical protein